MVKRKKQPSEAENGAGESRADAPPASRTGAFWRTICLHVLALVALSSSVLFLNLGGARLWDRDEPRNAGCALEMMERGDWVTPIFNGEIRKQKPVLIYWMIMSAYALFGVGEFAARFWSAAFAVGTVLATYAIGRRLTHPTVAWLAAMVLTTSVMFVIAGRAATPDSVLVFCSTIALMLYVVGTFAPQAAKSEAPSLKKPECWFPQSWPIVIAMYGFMALGVLAKGPVGLVMPTAIIGMFLLIQRLPAPERKVVDSRGWSTNLLVAAVRPFHPLHFLKTCWAMRPLTAVIMVLLIAGPWYVWVGLRTDGEWLRLFLLEENFGRATIAQESHGGGLWYYPLTLGLGFFPWSVFFLPVFLGLDKRLTQRDPWSDAYRFLLCWILVQVCVFSIASTKLPSYVTPCYPGLALLTGAFLYRLAVNQSEVSIRWVRLALLVFAVSGAVIGAGLYLVARQYLGGDWIIALLGAVPLVGGGLALWLSFKNSMARVVAVCSATALVFAVGLFGFATQAVDRHRQADSLLGEVRQATPQTVVATYQCLESSWVYYSRRPIYELSWSGIEGDPLVEKEHFWDFKPRVTPDSLIDSPHPFLIITTDEGSRDLVARFGNRLRVLDQSPYFLNDSNLVLIESANRTHMATPVDTAKWR